MEFERGREWRIYKKHFYIKKRLTNEINKQKKYRSSIDLNCVLRKHCLWYHLLGEYQYRIFKSNSWENEYNYRYGKKRYKSTYVQSGWWYRNANKNKLNQNALTKEILLDYGII